MISVIVPSLNEEKYISATLKSLKNQDIREKYEIIVSDGGSKDRTLDIAKKFADKIVIADRGISRGRNAGARIAKGDILMFVDADTILLFNTLSQVKKIFRKKGIVGAAWPVIPTSPQVKDFILYWMYSQFMKASIKAKRPQVAGISFACRRNVFEKVGGFDESMEVGEDFDLSKKLSDHGRFEFIEDALSMTSPRRIQKSGRLNRIRKHIEIYLNRLVRGKAATIEEYGGNVR
jgi:glycosyltransferase involved in cell wall biosynthesis